MNRVLHVSIAALILTGHVLAQGPPPAANAPGAAPGPGISCRRGDNTREQPRYPLTHCRIVSGVTEEWHNSRLSL